MPIKFALLLFALSVCLQAQTQAPTTLLADDFTQDTSLNQDLWAVNAGPLPRLAAAEIPGLQGLTTPQISFSKAGMTVTGVSGVRQFTGIRSKAVYTPPFTVQTTVMGVVAHANPFALYLVAAGDSQHLRITGNINPENTPAYKTAVGLKGGPAQTLDASPSVNKWYSLTVAVDAGGMAAVTEADESGSVIGRAEHLNVGVAPVMVVMAQSEFNPRTAGPNLAIWRRIAVVSGNQSQPANTTRAEPARPAGNSTPSAYSVTTVMRAAEGQRICIGGLAVDRNGDVYFSDCTQVKKVAVRTGLVTLVAGTAVAGYSGDGGPATSARLRTPGALAFDADGNLYVASSHTIRKIALDTGIITTVVGTGKDPGNAATGEGKPATARDTYPINGLAVDKAGNIYLVESRDSKILKVAAGTGIVSLLGTAAGALNMAVGSSGDLYYSITAGHSVQKLVAGASVSVRVAGSAPTDVVLNPFPNNGSGYSGDGGAATQARLSAPGGLALDAAGNLYIADAGNHCVRMIAAGTGIISTAFKMSDQETARGDAAAPRVIALDSSGNIYVAPGMFNGPTILSQMLGPIGAIFKVTRR